MPKQDRPRELRTDVHHKVSKALVSGTQLCSRAFREVGQTSEYFSGYYKVWEPVERSKPQIAAKNNSSGMQIQLLTSGFFKTRYVGFMAYRIYKPTSGGQD